MFLINDPIGVLLNSKEKHNENTKGVRENVPDYSYQLNTSELKRVWGFLCGVLVSLTLSFGRGKARS